MIDFFFYLLNSTISWLISLFPAYEGLPAGFSTAVATFSGNVRSFECVFPLDTLWDILVLNFWIALALLVFRFFRWVFKW